MRLCPIRVEKIVKCDEGGTEKVPRKKIIICGKKITAFVKLTYKELCNPLEAKFDDVFGLCPTHMASMVDPAAWNAGYSKQSWASGGSYFNGGVMHDLRGLVELVEPTEVPLDPKEEKLLRKLEAHKANIKRLMGQSNAVGLTVDHWRVAFEEILQDMIVKDVMDA